MKLKDLLNIKTKGESVVDALCKLDMEINEQTYTNLESNAVFEGAISYDSDLEEILYNKLNIFTMISVEPNDQTYLYTSIKELDKESSYIFMSDNDTNILVPVIDQPNRHGDDLPDETFLFFEDIIEVPNDTMDSCDICKKPIPRDILVNIDPANNIGDIKDEYEDFDGMVCPNCYIHDLCK